MICRSDDEALIVNRSTMAPEIAVSGASNAWSELECAGLEEPNEVSAVPDQIVVHPGEIIVLSTVKAGSESPSSRREESKIARDEIPGNPRQIPSAVP